MRVDRLNREQIRFVYQEYMQKDFPDNELKPLKMIEKGVAKQTYECFGLFEGEEICGYAFFVKLIKDDGRADYLFDYLAIREDLRDQGLGGTFLSLLAVCFPDANSMLGEVENPDYAKNEKERKTQERRLHFYLHNGIVDTGVTARVFGVEYRILEVVSDREHTGEQVKEIYGKIYRSFLPKVICRAKIWIR
ncbi:MAG: GNAT family N-acetyltransferase [Lachnospiraceae bacterium]|nr:GNAT family N-acetyltransferase [Lachnospiraceae bacterium]